MSGKTDILILGGTTHHNRGDRAMHEGLVRWLREAVPGARPVFLASNPELTAEVLGVESRLSPDAALAQPWTRETPHSTRQRLESLWRGWRWARQESDFSRQLASARAVVVPGSGSMNSLWWHDWLYVKAAEIHAARRAGVPAFMTSQGIGPAFSHWLDRRVARRMFNSCAFVGVRDAAQSLDILADIGVREKVTGHTGDDALLVPLDPEPASRLLAGVPAGRKIIGVNVRDSSTYGRKYPKPVPQVWAAALDAVLASGVDAHFVFLPVSYDRQDDDRVAARQVAAQLACDPARITLIDEELDAAALRGLAARCHAGFGISYHFLLFCLAAGVPALGLWQNAYYQHKQDGLFGLYESPDLALDLSRTDAPALASAMSLLLDNHAALSASLGEINARLASRSAAARVVLGERLRG